jgi:hypothetical protein
MYRPLARVQLVEGRHEHGHHPDTPPPAGAPPPGQNGSGGGRGASAVGGARGGSSGGRGQGRVLQRARRPGRGRELRRARQVRPGARAPADGSRACSMVGGRNERERKVREDKVDSRVKIKKYNFLE